MGFMLSLLIIVMCSYVFITNAWKGMEWNSIIYAILHKSDNNNHLSTIAPNINQFRNKTDYTLQSLVSPFSELELVLVK